MKEKIANRSSPIFIAVVIVVVLIAQARLLYIFPQPDSARWWGDETGQMLELRAEVQCGHARIPSGLGSSVAITNGIVRGNSWLAAAIYGAPAAMLSGIAGLVDIGRSITFLLSFVMLFVMYKMMRAFYVSQTLSLIAILMLVTTRSFFFASHAARLDIAAGLSVLVFSWYLASRFDLMQRGLWSASYRWYLFYGAISVLFATLSIHLLTLLSALSIFMCWRFGAFRKAGPVLILLGGVVTMLSILFSIYIISDAPITLFGQSVAPNQFQSVAGGLPILRPFSRSVQIGNILERLHGLWSEAPVFLILIVLAIIVKFVFRSREKSFRASFIWGAAIAVAVSWLLFESPAIYYYIQVLPIFIASLFIGISKKVQATSAAKTTSLTIAIILFCFAVTDTTLAGHLSESIARDNNSAISAAIDSIRAETEKSKIPIVLTQNPAITYVEHDKNVRLMTAHFISFPVSNLPIADVMKNLGVNYVLLYAAHDGSHYSQEYNVLRPIADSIGTVVLRRVGTLFDAHRDYFSRQTDAASPSLNTNQDTLILYHLPTVAR